LIINGNIAITEAKWWETESVLGLFSVCMTYSLFITGDKSWQTYITIMRENICQRYSACGKSFEIGILPFARYSHPLSGVLFKNSTHGLSNQNTVFSYFMY
jgi:hypothetical protein